MGRGGIFILIHTDAYWIDLRALAIKFFFTNGFKSKIYTTHGIYYSELDPRDLLNSACLIYFSTKKGRIQAATILLEYSKKTPFLISPYEFGVFPTASSKNLDCVWIFNQPFSIYEVAKGISIVTFIDGTSIKVNASKNIILKQRQRLYTLMSVSRDMVKQRDIHLERKHRISEKL
ncbi:competence protein ComK [Sporosarcina limicola]|uniref:Competence protein ComK n=1 Tax=Sporosarcina limicola TaxID=34101 RepID=A0A927R846_9BACL|nr:competence protein ComK [Sporosarcina limicola]MBE1556634.1 competence protein ComK [Sporosarcina limicola]